MKITDVRVRVVQNELYRPITNSLGRSLPARREITIVEVMTDAGITGVMGTIMFDDALRGIIKDHLRPQIVGQDPLRYERVARQMFGMEAQGWRPPFTGGEVVRAMSALDTCVWDIMGKALNTSCWRLLSGFQERIPCYASGGHYVTLGDHLGEMRYLEEEMSRYMQMGFKAVKMRVGRDLRLDCERAALVRKIIGPDARLMMDFNSSCTYHGGVPHALRFMRAMAAYDPYWFEDPLAMDDLAGYKHVADAVDTAIATGEYLQTLFNFREFIVNRAADILLPDPTCLCGGVSEWRRIANMAQAYRIPIAAHIGDNTAVHCVAAVPNGHIVEVFTPHDEAGRAYEKNPMARPDKDGMLPVVDQPGFAVELNEDYIRKHQVG